MNLLIFLLVINQNIGIINSETYIKQGNTISVHGNCFDVHTGANIIVRGMVKYNSTELLNISSNELGLFNFEIPVSTNLIIFESTGYKKISLPVNIISQSSNKQKFYISVPMSKLDSLSPPQPNQLSLSFSIVDTVEIDYRISLLENPETHIAINFKPGRTKDFLLINTPHNIGKNKFTGISGGGQVLINKEIFLKEGLNFQTIYVVNTLSDLTEGKLFSDNETTKSTDNFTLNFDQSSFILTDSSNTILDLVLRKLKNNERQTLTITGHTDNAGKEALNLTLSEYRARVVAQYFKQKGISSDQIKLDWNGSRYPKAPNDIENNRKKNRRVEIRLK